MAGTTAQAVMIEGGELICVLCNGRTVTSGDAIADFLWSIYRAVA